MVQFGSLARRFQVSLRIGTSSITSNAGQTKTVEKLKWVNQKYRNLAGLGESRVRNLLMIEFFEIQPDSQMHIDEFFFLAEGHFSITR